MLLNDRIDFQGVFSVKALDKDNNVIDEYVDNNLIMDRARQNMAQLVGGVTGAGGTNEPNVGRHINKFVLGTLGHKSTGILDNKDPNVAGVDGYESVRTALFSEEAAPLDVAVTQTETIPYHYAIEFDVTNDSLDYTDNTSTNAVVSMYNGTNTTPLYTGIQDVAATDVSVQRVVGGTEGRTVTYTITVPVGEGNPDSTDVNKPVIAYTEAALYAGEDIFSMKCFPARVKENTVKFEITWSIIF